MYLSFKFKPSGFYINFSMKEIVEQLKSPSGLICAKGSMGGVGTGTGHSDDEKAQYRKHDSFSCYIKPEEKEKFDEVELIRELKEKVENEIVRTGAGIVSGNRLTSTSFFFEYTTEDITGRIEITSGFRQENNFRIEISFDETSASQKQSLIERPLQIYQPVGNYHVVAFTSDDQTTREFYEKGLRASKKSKERFRQKYLEDKDNFKSEDYRTVMYVWTRTPAHIKEKLKNLFGDVFELSSEYDAFDKVYFLNDLMLQMYLESGEDVEVIKIVPAEEVAEIPWGPSFQGYYTPKNDDL